MSNKCTLNPDNPSGYCSVSKVAYTIPLNTSLPHKCPYCKGELYVVPLALRLLMYRPKPLAFVTVKK